MAGKRSRRSAWRRSWIELFAEVTTVGADPSTGILESLSIIDALRRRIVSDEQKEREETPDDT